MTFSEYLNRSMLKAHCNASELAAASGLSQAVISRYRSGERVPALGSRQLESIIHALAELSRQKSNLQESGPDTDPPGEDLQNPVFTEEQLRKELNELLHDEPGSVSLVPENLNLLLSSMNINIKKLSQSLSYDPSYISRIRSGKRKPSNPITFAEGINRYLMENCDREGLIRITAELSPDESSAEELKQMASELNSELPSQQGHEKAGTGQFSEKSFAGRSEKSRQMDALLEEKLKSLLLRYADTTPGPSSFSEEDRLSTLHFIRALDSFDLDEFSRAIHFDQISLPPANALSLPESMVCHSLEEMKAGELSFFHLTLLSKSGDDIYMCGDMEMADMAADLDFARKWMFSIASALKNGIRLNIIHSLDRPYHEMMLGLETWIPLYMTGRVSSFYLPGYKSRVYSHLHYSSAAAALVGEALQGCRETSRYYLTRNKADIAFYRNYSLRLFEKAKPLMEVFTRENAQDYSLFLRASSSASGSRRMILSSPPLACLPQKLLDRVLKRCDETEKARVLACVSAERNLFTLILKRDICEIELHTLRFEDFEKHPACLSLSGAFLDRSIYYTWEEYRQHLEATKAYAAGYPLCSLNLTERPGFCNIRIMVRKGSWAMVSKISSPTIHFLIRHPKLRSAIENMQLPVVEEEL